MAAFKVLIDTNVLIGLEDPKVISPTFAAFARKCVEHGVTIFVHQASRLDIERDKNLSRREITLSKINKFQEIEPSALPSKSKLEDDLGSIRNANDWVDVALLYSLKTDLVDFLVTDDRGIHGRIRESALSGRVLTVSDALTWLKKTFEPKSVDLPLIEEMRAHQIDPEDEIFQTLRADYPGFDKWWSSCVSIRRLCWVAKIGNDLAGLIVRKDEPRHEANVCKPGEKILKLCTFKVRPEFRGEKLGELLLKQALWFAQKNKYDLVYITTFPAQETLIRLLEFFGFENTMTQPNNELVFEKEISASRLVYDPKYGSLVDQCRKSYPRFTINDPAKIFCVPIQGAYHAKLFPELAIANPLPLFPDDQRSLADMTVRLPGNTIRKVYLCRSKIASLAPGDVLVFYHSKSQTAACSQSITTIGIVEGLDLACNFEELVRLTAKRSVFSEQELRQMIAEDDRPLRVIDFLLCGHFEPPVPLLSLLNQRVFNGTPPQSISRISPKSFASIQKYLDLGFDL